MPTYSYNGVQFPARDDAHAVAIIKGGHLQGATPELADPTDDMSTTDRVIAGVGSGMTNVARQAANMVGVDSIMDFDTSDAGIARQDATDAALLATTGGKVGQFLGEVAATAPIGGLAGAGLKTALGSVRAAPALARIGGLAGEGALEGAILGGPEGRLAGAGLGGLTGGTLGSVGELYRAVRPLTARGAEAPRRLLARTLQDPDTGAMRSVDLTGGQANPKSWLNVAEHLPGVRDTPLIKAPREQAYEQAVDVFMNEARAPGFIRRFRTAGEGVEELADEMASEFSEAYGRYASRSSQQTAANLANQLQSPYYRGAKVGSGLRNKALSADAGWLADELSGITRKRALTVGDLQSLRSRVRTYIGDVKRVQGIEPMRLDALNEVEKRLTKAIMRDLPPDEADALRAIDRQYAKFKVAEEAVYKGTGKTPTPSALRQSVKQAANKRGKKRSYVLGRTDADMRGIANDIDEVFEQVVPNTGAALGLTLASGAAGLGAGIYTESPTAGGIAGGAIPAAVALLSASTPAGRRIARRMAAKGAREPTALGQSLGALGRAAAINTIVDNYSE